MKTKPLKCECGHDEKEHHPEGNCLSPTRPNKLTGKMMYCLCQKYRPVIPLSSLRAAINHNIQEVCRLEELKKRRTKNTYSSYRTFENGFDEGWKAAWYFIRRKLKAWEAGEG